MSHSSGFDKVCVVGLGYIGLPTAAMFASRQVKVIGVDVNQQVVDTVNRGEIHIVEPDLDIVVRATVTDGWLRATSKPEPADAFLVAVPTPFKGEDHVPDLSYIESACHAIAPVLKSGDLVVLESTSPVGATEAMAGWLAAARPDLTFPQDTGDKSDIRVAHCPERVLPGRVMMELITNDRIVGGITPTCGAVAANLYRCFVTGNCHLSDVRTAELAKLAENSFRDVNIAYANELSLICDRLAVDVWELIRLSNRHPRVDILQPGPGVGGHCIAVDPWFVIASAPRESRLIKTARTVNDQKPEWVIGKINEALGSSVFQDIDEDLVVALYGLSFKANVDDLRESPALSIAASIARVHGELTWFVEPHIEKLPEVLEKGKLVSLESAAAAHVHVLLVDHAEFRDAKPLSGIIVDTRGLW